MRSPLSRGAADPFHPIRQRRGGDVNNHTDICRMEGGGTNKNRKDFLPPLHYPEFNMVISFLLRIYFTFSLFPACSSPYSLPVTLPWWALSECSTIAFSHSESLIKLQSPPPSVPQNYMAKGKGHLFFTKCLSHSFTWQQSSMSFPTVKCQIWKPSIRLMFRVRLWATFKPRSILQSNKSTSNLGDGKLDWQWNHKFFPMSFVKSTSTMNVYGFAWNGSECCQLGIQTFYVCCYLAALLSIWSLVIHLGFRLYPPRVLSEPKDCNGKMLRLWKVRCCPFISTYLAWG